MRIDRFLGLHNTKQARRLPKGALTQADNVDVDDLGGLVIREGFVADIGATSITAAYATRDQNRLFWIDSGNLVEVMPDDTTITLKTGMPSGRVYWTEAGSQIFMSTGHIIENEVSDWRIPTCPQPNVSVISGDLPAGQYQIACTYQSGREGGCSAPVVVDVADDSGLAITVPDLSPYDVNVYVSDLNGDVLYLADTLMIGGVTVHNIDLSYPLDSIHHQTYPVPEGISRICFYEAKLWAAQFQDGQTIIWYSKPFAWHLFDLYSDYLVIPGEVLMLEATPQGLVIGTSEEIYAYTKDEALVQLAEYGVVDGYPAAFRQDGNILIHTQRGTCAALPFKNLTEHKISLTPGRDCATAIVEQNGLERFVALHDGQGQANNTLG